MQREKKVVHITTVHHPLDPRIYYKECLSIQSAGYDVTLIAPYDACMDKSQIKVIPLKKRQNRFKRMLFSTVEALKQARKQKADYYHIHDPELLPVAWILKNKKNVVVYDIHEDYVTSIMQKDYLVEPLKRIIAKLYKMVEKKLCTNLDLCLAEKYYKESYPEGQCILNYPLVNEKFVNHFNQNISDKPTNKVIYTGNITENRGATIHARLPLLDEQISVHFFGKCSKILAEKMKAIAADEKDRLVINGIDRYVPKSEIDDQYLSQRWLAGIALFPPTDHYRKKELTKFFEYMSAGIPFICSDFPVWKQFVEKYQCGIAVNPDDDQEIKEALAFLRLHPQKAKQMGINGKRAIHTELNWETQANKLSDWYERIWVEKKNCKNIGSN